MDAFAAGVPAAEAAALHDPSVVLPWAVWRSPSGTRRATGISNMLLPEVKVP